MKPRIFISAVTRELGTIRQLVANVLTRLGYEPIWQEIFGTESGDLRAMLRTKIDSCTGLIHLVGAAYGAEPPQPDPEFGHVSYTQYEWLYARRRGKKTWLLFTDADYPADAPEEVEAAESRRLQDTWRERLRGGGHLRHGASTPTELQLHVERLKDELAALRRSFRTWQRAVLVSLVGLLILGGGIAWAISRQRTEVQDVKQEVREVVETEADRIRVELAKLRPDDIMVASSAESSAGSSPTTSITPACNAATAASGSGVRDSACRMDLGDSGRVASCRGGQFRTRYCRTTRKPKYPPASVTPTRWRTPCPATD